MALLSGLFDKLKGLLAPVLGPLQSIINLVTRTKETITGLASEVQTSVDNTKEIIAELKMFSLQPNFKTRVVNLPIALQHIENFVTAVKDIGQIVKAVAQRLKDVDAKSESESEGLVSEDVQTLEESAAKLGPKVGKVAGKLLGWLTVALSVIGNLEEQWKEANSAISDILEIVKDIDKLNGLFLQQNNSRKWVLTAAGQRIRIRVGKLHG